MNDLDTILNNMQEGKDLDFKKLLFEFAKKMQQDEKEINDNKTDTTNTTKHK